MPHQWMEGNLPVSSSCLICKKTCGSVLRLQDWRCLWCRATVHTACRPFVKQRCPLGSAQLSVIPPTSVHSIGIDEAWDVVKPNGSYSPLLVFVNSKSGDNQGVKFLRRFKQILNPAQVFDLVSAGPGLGLRLFRHFEPFRILVCSGDGSVGWVLSEIDRMDLIVSIASTLCDYTDISGQICEWKKFLLFYFLSHRKNVNWPCYRLEREMIWLVCLVGAHHVMMMRIYRKFLNDMKKHQRKCWTVGVWWFMKKKWIQLYHRIRLNGRDACQPFRMPPNRYCWILWTQWTAIYHKLLTRMISIWLSIRQNIFVTQFTSYCLEWSLPIWPTIKCNRNAIYWGKRFVEFVRFYVEYHSHILLLFLGYDNN